MEDWMIKTTAIEQRSKSNTHQIDELKERLERNEEKIERLNEANVTLARITTVLEQMQEEKIKQDIKDEKILATLDSIQDTLAATAANMNSLEKKQETMKENINTLSEKIDIIDDKTKVELDWASWVKQYFWKGVAVLVSGGLAGYLFRYFTNF